MRSQKLWQLILEETFLFLKFLSFHSEEEIAIIVEYFKRLKDTLIEGDFEGVVTIDQVYLGIIADMEAEGYFGEVYDDEYYKKLADELEDLRDYIHNGDPEEDDSAEFLMECDNFVDGEISELVGKEDTTPEDLIENLEEDEE